MKKVFTGLLAFITFIPAVSYFVSCFTPYISPVHFWPMAFLALGFPYLAIVILIFAFFWFFFNKKVSLILLLLFFAGFQNLFSTFALKPANTAYKKKDTRGIRIMTWNVRGFSNPAISGDSIRQEMLNYIKKVDPDVLCLQEFSEQLLPGIRSNTEDLRKQGFVYFLKTNEVPHYYNYGKVLSGTAIFSKIRVSAPHQEMLGDTSYIEYLTSVDVSLGNKKVRIFTTHFKSINLFAKVVDSSNRVIFYGDSTFVYTATKAEKLKAFAQAHSKEAIIAKRVIDKSPYPVVIGMDMNSVPTSYPYHIMSSNLQDAFKFNGWGLGTTLDSLPKTLRIDFLLVDKKLAIQYYHKDNLHLSDHFPQFIDVLWKDY